MQRPRPTDEVFQLNIYKIVYGGDGIGKHDGQTVFVPFSAPGDHLRVRVIESRKNFKRAIIEEIITPSPTRQNPPCPHFGICGGCQLQHVSYEAQLEIKTGLIRESLRRIGHIDWPGEIPIIHSEPFGYRARAQFKIDNRHNRIGFYRAASHDVEDIESCPLLKTELNEELSRLRKDHEPLRNIGQIEVATDGTNISRSIGNSDPDSTINQTVGELNYKFDARTFFQINPGLLNSMVDTAIGDAKGDLAVDLYCGVGLFTVPLSKRFGEVIGVEGNERSAKFAAQNLKSNGSENATIYARNVEDWVIENTGGSHEVDFLLLDPPRAGIAGDALTDIIAIKAQSVVYVSCDPTTLARDLRGFVAAGYSIVAITGFDLFPQTFHVETCVHLKRN